MTTFVKFFPTIKESQDLVVWVDDIEEAVREKGYTEAIGEIMDRVISGDLKCSGYVHVIDDNKDLAKTMAVALDQAYQKEMELMKQANIVKEEVQELVEKSIAQGKPAVDEDKNAAARAFLEENGPAVMNSKKAPAKKEEEKEMEETKKLGRKKLAGGRKQEETNVENNTNEKVEKDMRKGQVNEDVKVTGRKRLTGGRKGSSVGSSAPKKKLSRAKRSSSLRNSGFEKHEGQWWTNVSLYPELEYVQVLVDNQNEEGVFSCPEIGIESFVFVEPTEISRYKNREDIDVVIQIKANGNVLEFPIKEASSNSKSPLTSTSIGWVEYNGKVSPRFGFWRPNALEVEMECGCGKKFKSNTGNLYCPSCKTRHDDAQVEVEHESLDFAGEIAGWVFQEVPNLVVPKSFLAIVMAMAHWDAGYDVEGLVEEEDGE
jgi:hypothetical protein